MKKIVSILFLGLLSTHLFAQKIIETPDYGYSTIPGEITKIEILDSTTVLHFHLKMTKGSEFSIPKKTYIQDLSADEKLFVVKADGITLNKWEEIPDSGEIFYQLYFPKLNSNVKTIEFGEANERGDWFVYDIIINENENASLLPKELRGNWLLADGSNRWDYGFHSQCALVDGALWNYKSVDKKGEKYTITLEKKGYLKTILAKLGKNGKADFGNDSKSLKSYSLTKVKNPNFKLKEDTEFKSMTFSLDSTTYSGIIKGFSDKMKQRTAMIHINNTFTGNQESHIIKINDDGTFKTKFPLTHSQTVFIRMPSNAFTVFLEPNKETFHYIDGKTSLFMGDNVQVNSDLDALKDMRLGLDMEEIKRIGVTSPEDHKKTCNILRLNALNKLVEYQKNNFVSKKALQIKNIDLELEFYQGLLGYGIYRSSLKYQNEKAKSEADKIPYQEFEVKNDYYDFLTKDIPDNELLTLSNGYYFFTNRLVYSDIFKVQGGPSRLTKVEIADGLQKRGVELTLEELNMVESSKQIETPEIRAKEAEFRKKYGEVEQGFYKNYKGYFKEVEVALKENKIPKHNNFKLSVADYLKSKDIKVTDKEAEMVEALRVLKTPAEIEKERLFNDQFKDVFGPFNTKYSDYISQISMDNFNQKREQKISAFFGKQNSFLQNVIKMQSLSKRLEDFKIYSNHELAYVQETLNSSFLKSYLATLNEQTKKKIEVNKSKGGYTVHNVEKSEGDELFEAMIEKFKGKVVYVDFWATWCGPCKSGISKIAPLKEEMKNDNVVFLYVTNQTSPEGTWKNAIADIKGEHYRVSDDEWNYLTQKFNISGIPHYTLVDKQGNVVNPKLGHMDNTGLKSMLMKELNK